MFWSNLGEANVQKNIVTYLDKHNVLFHSQYSFRKRHLKNLATLELVTKGSYSPSLVHKRF